MARRRATKQRSARPTGRSRKTAPAKRKTRGGQEPPASVKDRPEQNKGYDEAVHGKDARPLENPPTDFDFDLIDEAGSPEALHEVPPHNRRRR